VRQIGGTEGVVADLGEGVRGGEWSVCSREMEVAGGCGEGWAGCGRRR